MIQFLMPVSAFIAGALLYFALYKDLDENIINTSKNIFFPVLCILVVICGVYIVENVHLSEVAVKNSNQYQNVQVMGCIIESSADCSTLANTKNAESSAAIQSGKASSANFYIPFALRDVIPRNILSYFVGGVLIVWIGVFIFNFKK